MTDQLTRGTTSESEGTPTTEPARRAASGAEVVRCVEALAGRTEKSISVKDVLGALRAETSVQLNLPDRQRVVQVLKTLDPDWSLILDLAYRSLGTRDAILARLGRDLIDEARRIAGLPDEADTTTVVDAVQVALRGGTSTRADGDEEAVQRPSPALVLTGLLSQRELPSFVDSAITVLQMSEKPGLERGREHLVKACVELIDKGAAKQRERALALLEPLRRRLAEKSAGAERAAEELAALRQRRDELHVELEQHRQAHARVCEERDAARQQRDEVEAQGKARVRDLELLASTELARWKAETRRIVERELETLRLYLDSQDPDVQPALDRLRVLDDLARKLGEQ